MVQKGQKGDGDDPMQLQPERLHPYHHRSCIGSPPIRDELSQLSEVGQPSLCSRNDLQRKMMNKGDEKLPEHCQTRKSVM